jgi:hypothetical protein
MTHNFFSDDVFDETVEFDSPAEVPEEVRQSRVYVWARPEWLAAVSAAVLVTAISFPWTTETAPRARMVVADFQAKPSEVGLSRLQAQRARWVKKSFAAAPHPTDDDPPDYGF